MLALHLAVPLLAGMVTYSVGCSITHVLERRLRIRHAAILGVLTLVIVMVALVSAIVRRAAQTPDWGFAYDGMLVQMANALDQLKTMLPLWLAEHLPDTFGSLRGAIASWLREHAAQVQLWGRDTLRGATYVLAGFVIGCLAVLQAARHRVSQRPGTPWLAAASRRFMQFDASFRAVVFAQVRIAAINTALTGLYILVVLPAIGAPLPFATTLVVFTFIAGLIPVIGNLLSNFAIVVVSLSHGLGIASLSLAYLVVIHKLEYFLNAHIVGESIHAKAYELLVVMLVFEAAFGLGGLVMAPIVYAYSKAELRAAGWI